MNCLHLCCKQRSCSVQLVRYLLENGVNTVITSKEGTVLQLAALYKNNAIKKEIYDYMIANKIILSENDDLSNEKNLNIRKKLHHQSTIFSEKRRNHFSYFENKSNSDNNNNNHTSMLINGRSDLRSNLGNRNNNNDDGNDDTKHLNEMNPQRKLHHLSMVNSTASHLKKLINNFNLAYYDEQYSDSDDDDNNNNNDNDNNNDSNFSSKNHSLKYDKSKNLSKTSDPNIFRFMQYSDSPMMMKRKGLHFIIIIIIIIIIITTFIS